MFVTTMFLIASLLVISLIPKVHQFINKQPMVGVGLLSFFVLLELLLSGVFWQTISIVVYSIFVIVLLVYISLKTRNQVTMKLGQKAFAVATSIFVVLTIICIWTFPVSHYSGNGFTGIGLKKYTVINKYRMSPLNEEEARKYVLNIYYPSSSKWTRKSDKYGYEGKVIANYFNESNVGSVLLNHIPQMNTIARRDGPIAEGKHPLLVISPDQNQLTAFYEQYAKAFVDEGYIVAIINHPYLANYTMFNDGSVAEYQAEGLDHELIMKTMTDDIVDAIDVIENLSKGVSDEFFTGAIDFEGMTVVGHGLGAAATINASFDDKRIRQVAVLDPNIEPISQKYYADDFDKPLLVISSKKGYNQSMTRLSRLMRHVTSWGVHYKTDNDSRWSFTNQGSFVKDKNCVNDTILLLKKYMIDRYNMIEQEYQSFEIVYQK